MFSIETNIAIIEAIKSFACRDFYDQETWKNLHLRLSADFREIRRVTPRTLKSYVMYSLIFDIKRNKFHLPEEVVRKICYPFLTRLLQIKLTVVNTESFSEISACKLERQKVIVRYLQSTQSFDEELWNEMHKLFEEHPEEYHIININNPHYGLTETEKNVLNRFTNKNQLKKIKTNHQSWDRNKWFIKKTVKRKEQIDPVIAKSNNNNNLQKHTENKESNNVQISNEIVRKEKVAVDEIAKRISPNKTDTTRKDPRLFKMISDIPTNSAESLTNRPIAGNNHVSSSTGTLTKIRKPSKIHKESEIAKGSKIEHGKILAKNSTCESPSNNSNGLETIDMYILQDNTSKHDVTNNELATTILPCVNVQSTSTTKVIQSSYTKDLVMINGLRTNYDKPETQESSKIDEEIIIPKLGAVIEISSDEEEFTIPYSFYDTTSSEDEEPRLNKLHKTIDPSLIEDRNLAKKLNETSYSMADDDLARKPQIRKSASIDEGSNTCDSDADTAEFTMVAHICCNTSSEDSIEDY